jgi:hypothetical protein
MDQHHTNNKARDGRGLVVHRRGSGKHGGKYATDRIDKRVKQS